MELMADYRSRVAENRPRLPSAVAVILPARCFVAHEDVVRAALDEALTMLPLVPEGVVTLGMRNIDDGADEDYLARGPTAMR